MRDDVMPSDLPGGMSPPFAGPPDARGSDLMVALSQVTEDGASWLQHARAATEELGWTGVLLWRGSTQLVHGSVPPIDDIVEFLTDDGSEPRAVILPGPQGPVTAFLVPLGDGSWLIGCRPPLSDGIDPMVEAFRVQAMVSRAALTRVQSRIVVAERERDRQRVLASELDHRLRNLLGLVRALVRGGAVAGDLDARIEAIGRAQDALRGESARDLRMLVSDEISPYVRPEGPAATFDGPTLALSPDATAAVALVVHELATNAVKYGALSRPEGSVSVAWHVAPDGGLAIAWRERGGPQVEAPAHRGFGSGLIEEALRVDVGGAARVTYAAEGVEAALSVPKRHLRAPLATEIPPPVLPEAFRVLVVEDNALLALDLDETLRDLGASHVALAGSVAEAMIVLDEAAVDVVFLDIDLGGETSASVAARLRAAGTPFAYLTGHGPGDGRFLDGAPILRKPFGRTALERILAETLIP